METIMNVTWTKAKAVRAAKLLQELTKERQCILFKDSRYFACEVIKAKIIIIVGGASLVGYC